MDLRRWADMMVTSTMVHGMVEDGSPGVEVWMKDCGAYAFVTPLCFPSGYRDWCLHLTVLTAARRRLCC